MTSPLRRRMTAIALAALVASGLPTGSGASGSGAAGSGGAGGGRTAEGEVEESPRYELRYEARLLPSKGLARASLRTDGSGLLRELAFRRDPERFFRFEADGELEVGDSRVTWTVPGQGGELRYTVKVDHLRESAEYDARLTERWGLFRGSDLFPTSRSVTAPGARSRASLWLRVPPSWEVVTPFPRNDDGGFRIDQDDRRLDRPSGWMVMGEDLVVHEGEAAGTRITIAGPDDHDLRVRDLMMLLRITLPHLGDILGELPGSLLVVCADDPMWRGGLSGPRSLYLHADRPMIERDGTSPILHEILHVATRAVSDDGGDWIVEGLAENYSLELLSRSGAVSDAEVRETLEEFERRAVDVEDLETEHSDRDVTARAVLLLRQLDERIRKATDGRRSLDDVARGLAQEAEVVTPASFRRVVARTAGEEVAATLPGGAKGGD